MTNLLDTIRNAVHDAVWDEIYRGHRYGCVLSGGIDSSTVTTLAREVRKDLPVLTGYYQGDRYDERQWARLVAGINHHEIEITPQDWVDNIEKCVRALQGARVGPGVFGQYMVAKYADEQLGLNTVFSGEGGDELFGGYARLAIVAGERVPDGYENYSLPDMYPRDVEAALRHDLADLPNLLEADRLATEPFGIVSVAPLTDIRVVANVLSRPVTERLGKRLLRKTVRGLVPDAIVDRTDKRGFPVPFVEWANGPLHDWFNDKLGYVPDIGSLWDRQWWNDLCDEIWDTHKVAA